MNGGYAVTIWDLLARTFRRWYVFVPALCATAVALLLAVSTPPVYSERFQVVLLAPPVVGDNPYSVQISSLITFAGAVERSINGTSDGLRASSEQVTLVGTGIKDGTRVAIPNFGGQWANNFSEPAITVEVVGTSAESTRLASREELARVHATIDRLQDEQGVPSDMRILTQLSPAEPEVLARSGSDVRAAIAVLAVGAISTLLLMSRGAENAQRPRPKRKPA